MRKPFTLIPKETTPRGTLMLGALAVCLIAAFVAGACGDKTPKTSDANAAEVTTPSPETPGVPTTTEPVVTGPVSF